MNGSRKKDYLEVYLSLYQSFVTMLSLFLGFILATITIVSFLQAPIEWRRPTLWLLLTSFATIDFVFVRTHSRVLKEMTDRGLTLICPRWNDELLTLGIGGICISFCFMLLIGGLTISEAIIWGIISVILTIISHIQIYKAKHPKIRKKESS